MVVFQIFIDNRHLIQKGEKRIKLSPKVRYNILKRDGFICQYCGASGDEKSLEIDHVVPISKGGTNDEQNLLTSCRDCNRGKSDTNLFSKNNSSIIYPLNIVNPILNEKITIALFSFKKEGVLTTAEISRKINSNFSYSSEIVKILKSCMLIEDVVNVGDKRKKYYKITGKGEMVSLKLLEIVYLLESN